ncbi:alpha/beta hydrolase [Flaviaesturariibacter flavus]|uniref:Alpha/beta hydrolase n=1 Tax=Flaviaesturariibacter flavus TaxID=2502780 RepID=A0A4R1BBQ2_9BACT|nr:alpha/beta hydrolase [Flaviaesturariibacter flavus]TCJ14430.1 alpha/beta hydrolase [Flaviaesturariibacter flavus]
MSTTDSMITCKGQGLFVHRAEDHPGRPTLVFLHDSLGSVSLWRDFPQRLAGATDCNLLVYDRRGYGRSEPFATGARTPVYLEQEADTLQALLLQLGIGNALLFGHSDGASIALITAAKYPEGIRAVISEAAHIFVEEETLDGIRAALRAYIETDLKARLARYHGDKTEAVFRAWTDTWLNPGFRNWNITHFLPRITCPVLLIQGSADNFGTDAQVNGIRDGVRGTVSVFLPDGVGHTPHKEAMEATMARATEFIRMVAG